MTTVTARPNIPRLFLGGLAAGLVINEMEYLVHGMFLDAQWTAAFAALGRKPTGWATFIPANFLVGIIAIWVYTRLRPSYGPGPKTAVRAALAVWLVFWVVPEAALQPLGRVEEKRGTETYRHSARFSSPLIKPDVPISSIRLSDGFHARHHAGAPRFLLRVHVQFLLKFPDLTWRL